MTNESSTGGNSPIPDLGSLGSLGAAVDPKSKDPTLKMKHSSVTTLGKNVGAYGDDLTRMSRKTGDIDMHEFTFGAIGGGLNVAHRGVRDSAVEALKQAKDVLDSWQEALNAAATNVRDAEDASKAGNGKNGGKIPGLDGAGLPKGAGGLGGMPKTGGLPTGTGLGDMPKTGLDPSDLGKPPGTDQLKPPGTDQLKPPDTEQLKPPDQPDLGKPDVPQPNVPDMPEVKQPEMPQVQQPDVKTPDLSGLDQPGRTDLAGVNPNLPTSGIPQVKTPDISSLDPRATTMPRTTVGPDGGFSVSPGGTSGPGSGLGAPGSIARALNTGTPIYPPPMGGAGAGAGGEEKDRERGPHLGEDEGVWGGDEDITPAVLGREE